NTVHFGSGGIVNVPAANNGTIIAYTIPNAVGPHDLNSANYGTFTNRLTGYLRNIRRKRTGAKEQHRFIYSDSLRAHGSTAQSLLPAEPPFPMLIRPHRPQEVDLSEGRPGHIAEIELAVGALP